MAKLEPSAHTRRPWRIHAVAPDLRLEDVWALPTPGGADDFDRLEAVWLAIDPERESSAPVRLLFALRWKLGALLRLDGEDDGVGARVGSLRDRLPADLRAAPRGPDLGPFTSVYRLEDEWALELANRTVHAVLHLGWVEEGAGAYRGQMAVLVKPNGRLGSLYMAAIAPFRHHLVYPRLLRDIGAAWRAHG